MNNVKDVYLSQKITEFGIVASDYWASLTMVDAPEPMRVSYIKTCRDIMEAKLNDVMKYVEDNYERKRHNG